MPTGFRSPTFLTDAITAGVMLALVLAVQNLRLPNLVTGTVVNAVFTATLATGGLRCAVMLAGLTPVGAFLTGHLPAPLILLMPVIIPGNIIYVVASDLAKSRSLVGKAIAAAAAKAILIGSGGLLLSRWAGWPPETLALLGGITGIQFATAVAGVLLGETVAARITKRA